MSARSGARRGRRGLPRRAGVAALLVAACAGDAPLDPGATSAPVDDRPALAIASGTVRDSAGRPVAHADVYVGTLRARDRRAVAACEDGMSGLLSLARTVTDAAGRYRARVPAAEPGDAPDCVWVAAEQRDAAATVGAPQRFAAEWRAELLPVTNATALAEVRIDLVGAPVAPPANPPFRLPDDDWAEVASTKVPGFAGFFLDGPKVIVQLKDPTPAREATARAYVAAALARAPNGSDIVIRRVDYDYAELRRWYDRVQPLHALPGLSTADIDEDRNRIALTYLDSVSVRRAAGALATLDVPAGAVVLTAARPIARVPVDTFGPAEPIYGTRLAPRVVTRSPTWSPDGRTIYFTDLHGWVAPGVTTLRLHAVDVATRAVRALASMRIQNSGHESPIRPTADGRALHVSAMLPDGPLRLAIFRVPLGAAAGDSVARIADDLGWSLYAIAPDGRRLAYLHADAGGGLETFGVREPASGRWWGLYDGLGAIAAPLDFSPDGEQLLYTRGVGIAPAESSGVWLFSARDGSTRRVIPFASGTRPLHAPDVRWVDGAPHLLAVEREGDEHALFDVDARTGARTRLGAVPAGEGSATAAAWSRDGRRAAVWTLARVGPSACVPGSFCSGATLKEWRLYVWTQGERAPRLVADRVDVVGASWLGFSPDGGTVAYELGGLYVQTLP